MYKVGIIGGGPAGLFAAYSLSKDSNCQVFIFEGGKPLEKRKCPIIEYGTKQCYHCKTCALTNGISGAGAFSDGKYILSTEYGGWLQDILGNETAMYYMEQADKILVGFGATEERYMPDQQLKQEFLRHNIHMLNAQCKHLGTDGNYVTMNNMVNYLLSLNNVTILTDTRVVDVKNYKKKNIYVVDYSKNPGNIEETIYQDFDYVIFAVGRYGNGFFSNWCNKNNIQTINNQVDIGVRVELPYLVWKDYTDRVYEPKLLYKTKQYEDKVRSFCVNPRGKVVTECNDGILSVNGHSYTDPSMLTENTNFALLSTINFTEPFNKPVEYVRSIASLSNAISGGGVIVQTLGDLERGRRTNEKRLQNNFVQPTLNAAIPGDLSLCMPKRQLDNIIETLHAINEVIPGTSNPETLLYGVEIKTYSSRLKNFVDFEFDNNGVSGYFAIGDGAGVTRSLSQASANGLYVAKIIKDKQFCIKG